MTRLPVVGITEGLDRLEFDGIAERVSEMAAPPRGRGASPFQSPSKGYTLPMARSSWALAILKSAKAL